MEGICLPGAPSDYGCVANTFILLSSPATKKFDPASENDQPLNNLDR